MCRFVYYQGQPIALSALLTEPANSLIHQSFHANERTEPLNGDGFGVAWYVPGSPAPALFRSVSPAWSNQNLHEIARVTTSPRVLAHVRAATQEFSVTVSNCHPFRHGALTFMHNGDFGAFSRVRRSLLRSLSDDAFRLIRGTTDSEHFFALVVDEMGNRDVVTPPAARLTAAIEGALGRFLDLARAEGVDEPVYMNCVVSDGRAAVACRFTTDRPDNADSLYTHVGHRYVVEARKPRMESCEPVNRSVIVSSEPLSDDPGWEPVPAGSLVVVGEDLSIEARPVSA